MTISEQLREAALYSRDPLYEVPFSAWQKTMDFLLMRDISDWSDVNGRTFMLLVAEALE